MKITDKNIAIFKKWYIKDCTVRNKDFFHFSVRNIKESRKNFRLSFSLKFNQEP